MTISSSQDLLTTHINPFLATKSLSDNSKQAYSYDLKQFSHLIEEQLEVNRLKQYENYLRDLKPSVQRRKRSAVNQFLAYLYQEGLIDNFLKLEDKKLSQTVVQEPSSLDLSELYQGPVGQGKLACLLFWDLGLLPMEALSLTWADVDLDFGVVTVAKGAHKRVLRLSQALIDVLRVVAKDQTSDLVFNRQGQPYSRQWLYKQVQGYVASCGHPEVTAQVLRQQFILREIKKGTGAFELARLLGLKSPVTLEKYYRT